MKTITIHELREHLDEYLDLVRGGEVVEITDEKGRVAQLVPTTRSEKTAPDVESLIAAGKLRRSGSGKVPDDLLTRPLAKSSGSVLEDLLKEREEGW
jgi:prevent-host-death family protein